MKKLKQLFIWFKNLFSKKGLKENYFTSALKNVRAAAIKKVTTRREAKLKVVNYVKFLQTGPKKSNFEIQEILKRKGYKVDENGNVVSPSLYDLLKRAGVRTNWQKMQFLN